MNPTRQNLRLLRRSLRDLLAMTEGCVEPGCDGGQRRWASHGAIGGGNTLISGLERSETPEVKRKRALPRREKGEDQAPRTVTRKTLG